MYIDQVGLGFIAGAAISFHDRGGGENNCEGRGNSDEMSKNFFFLGGGGDSASPPLLHVTSRPRRNVFQNGMGAKVFATS